LRRLRAAKENARDGGRRACWFGLVEFLFTGGPLDHVAEECLVGGMAVSGGIVAEGEAGDAAFGIFGDPDLREGFFFSGGLSGLGEDLDG